MAHLLEARLESVGEPVEIVPGLPRRPRERRVGHEHGPGDVSREHESQKCLRGIRGSLGPRHPARDRVVRLDQRELGAQLKVAGGRRQPFGEGEHATVGIEATHRRRVGVTHHDAVSEQPLHEPRVSLVRLEVGRDGLGRRLQLGKVVVVALDERRHLVRRRTQLGHRQLLVDHLPEHQHLIAHVAVGPIQLDHRPTDAGQPRHQLFDLVVRRVVRLEEVVAEHLHEVAGQASVFVGRERGQVDLIGLQDLDQHGGGERPLVTLDEVEVAGRDPELLGHASLGEPPAATKRPDLASQLHPRPPFDLYRVYSFTACVETASTTSQVTRHTSVALS